ncbi:MAG: protein phosphatase 2C domain-containing protein [Chitinophagaceae bacterium]
MNECQALKSITSKHTSTIKKSDTSHCMNLSSIYYLHEIGGKKNQEDYIWPSAGTAKSTDKIFIVCDGVGGSENGEIASRIIAEYVGKNLSATPQENITIDTVNHFLHGAKQELFDYAAAAGLNKDMATTFCLLVLFSNRALVAWCGDSRIYQVRKGDILYRTADHSLVNSLVKSGEITEEEALAHPQRHIILKAVNADDSPAEAEGQWIEDISAGDYFLLCTDGLLENITDADIKALLASDSSLNAAIIPAIQEYCFGKTRDNYSLYLLQTGVAQKIFAQKKTASSSPVLWLTIIIGMLLAGGLYLFIKKDKPLPIPAAVLKSDSAMAAPITVIVTKDTLAHSDSLPYVELENVKEGIEKTIIPAPLPETTVLVKGTVSTVANKGKDTIQLNLSTLQKNKKQAEKKEAGSRPQKPLN